MRPEAPTVDELGLGPVDLGTVLVVELLGPVLEVFEVTPTEEGFGPVAFAAGTVDFVAPVLEIGGVGLEVVLLTWLGPALLVEAWGFPEGLLEDTLAEPPG